MPRRRRRRKVAANALAIVRQARAAAKSALDSLREEIKSTAARLQKLISEERSFKFDLFGGATRRARGAAGRRRAVRRGRPPKRASAPRRRGTPRAERFFSKLPRIFTLEDVRKIAGSKAGISLAQWSRAKRIKKTAAGYQKTAA
jgi:hypothetical protein